MTYKVLLETDVCLPLVGIWKILHYSLMPSNLRLKKRFYNLAIKTDRKENYPKKKKVVNKSSLLSQPIKYPLLYKSASGELKQKRFYPSNLSN